MSDNKANKVPALVADNAPVGGRRNRRTRTRTQGGNRRTRTRTQGGRRNRRHTQGGKRRKSHGKKSRGKKSRRHSRKH